MQENDIPVVAYFSYSESILYFIAGKSFRSALPKPQLLMLKVWTIGQLIGWGGLSLIDTYEHPGCPVPIFSYFLLFFN